MKPADYRLVAAILKTALDEDRCEPELIRDFTLAFVKQSPKDFDVEDFLRRCAPPQLAARIGNIVLQRRAPEPVHREPEYTVSEQDGMLFRAIAYTDFPEAKALPIRFLFTSEKLQFRVSKDGAGVVIRFGSAVGDPVASVAKAMPEALAMVRGQTTAKEVRAR